MKTFKILVECFTTVVVSAENEDQALEVASDWVRIHGMDTTMTTEKELVTTEEIEATIRHSEWHSHDNQKTPYGD